MSYRSFISLESVLIDRTGKASAYFQRWLSTFLSAVAMAGLPVVTAAWTPGLIANGASASTTVSVMGAAFGDFALVSYDKALASGLTITANVSAADTVRVTISNNSGAGVTPTPGNFALSVLQKVNQ